MRYRRGDKQYFELDESKGAHYMAAMAMANAMANEPNKQTFLLIRNGENVHQVWSELSTQDAPRLFPTMVEVEKLFRHGGYFSGLDGTRITVDDLTYTDAREAHDKVALFYKRLLILMWGLNDRLGLFGEFYDRQRWASWLALDFQQQRFRFVHDDEGALTEIRPSYRDWAKERNRHLLAGSRVICVWSDVMTATSAPGAVKDEYWQGRRTTVVRYKPIEPWGFAVVRKRGDDLVVTVRCRYDGYRDVKRPEADIEVALNRLKSRWGGWAAGFLVLDSATAADLDYYLNSRQQREVYLNYVQIFVAARNRLRDEEAEAAPFLTAARDGLVASGLAVASEMTESALTEAIRLWRAGRYGRAVPRPGDRDYREVLRVVGQHVHRLLGMSGDPVPAIEAEMLAQGRTPLRLVATGKGRLALYATPTAGETMPLGVPMPWVAKFPVTFTVGRSLEFGVCTWPRLPKSRADESILRQWPEADGWIERNLPEGRTDSYEFELCRQALECLNQAERSEVADILSGRPRLSGPEVSTWLQRLDAKRQDMEGERYVFRPEIVVPLALVAVHTNEYDRPRQREGAVLRRSGLPNLRVMGIGADLISMLYCLADEDGKSRIARWFARVYAAPESCYDKLVKTATTWRPSLRMMNFAIFIESTSWPDTSGLPSGVWPSRSNEWATSIQALLDMKMATESKQWDFPRYNAEILCQVPWADAYLGELHAAWPEAAAAGDDIKDS